MPKLYSAARIQTQVSRKQEMLVTAGALRKYYLGSEDGLHPSWDTFFQYWPTQSEIDDEIENKSTSSGSMPKLAPIKDKEENQNNIMESCQMMNFGTIW